MINKAEIKQKIESFEIITLHTSGMRYSADFEIVMKGGVAEVFQYQIRHRYPENERILEKRVSVGNDKTPVLLNNCKLLSRDGFHGKHPRGVLDGIMFSLNAIVNGGKKVPKARRIFRSITEISRSDYMKYSTEITND